MIGRANDPEALSTKPAQIRRRLRRAIGTPHYEEDLRLYAEHDSTFKPLEEWDIEELARGMPRNKRGKFSGKPASWITPAVTKEAKRRLMDHTAALLGARVDDAMQVIVDLMQSEEVDDKGKPIVDARTKLECAKFIIEHVKGKATALIEVEATDTTRQMLAAAIVLDDGLPQDEQIILEGEFEEMEDEPVDGE